ncbi:MAG: radical SAM family heme chaperone HemW [Magnetococcales bacterium]|nr:radical SAM family heme chaperone HemW [Magnetococcales bacterium]
MPPPLALYIHVPYCVHKCPYCDFHSTVQQTVPEVAYIAAVKRELLFWRQRLKDDKRHLHSIFFGGGTPSLLKGESVGQLLKQITTLWQLSPQCEVTLESNPESCSPAKIAQWLNHGVNRLSLGIQAFNQERLTYLERPHSLEDARKAIQNSRRGGFTNINLDLIFATPSQTINGWMEELDEAMDWQPEHLSCYSLSIEKNTPFAKLYKQGKIQLLDEDRELEFFTSTEKSLAAGGWQGYEISNFAQPGRSCQHNLNYWQSGDYIGVGPSAHGRLTKIDNNSNIKILRTINRTSDYIESQREDGSCLLNEHLCTSQESGIDCLLMGLRLTDGMNRESYKKLRGYDLVAQQPEKIAELQKSGLLKVSRKKIAITKKGKLLTDSIIEKLID